MNKGLDIAKKNELWSLINQISKFYGGDDKEFLREYAKDIYEACKDDLGTAIECFAKVLSDAKACR